MLLVLPAGHARYFFGNHLHNGGAFFCREIENGKFLLHTVPKVDAMRGLFVCNVSSSDAAKIGDVPLCRFAVNAHIFDENCTPMYVTALAPACILVEFSRLPSHCEGHRHFLTLLFRFFNFCAALRCEVPCIFVISELRNRHLKKTYMVNPCPRSKGRPGNAALPRTNRSKFSVRLAV
jgi:hypothetical protein